MYDNARVFISAVSNEFASARQHLARQLQYLGYDVVYQEQIKQTGDVATLLGRIAKSLKECSRAMYLVGYLGGSTPAPDEASWYRHKLPNGWDEATYTQWEFFLRCMPDLHARGCNPPGSEYLVFVADECMQPAVDVNGCSNRKLQLKFRDWLKQEGVHCDYFSNLDELKWKVLEKREFWPRQESVRPRNLPFSSLGKRFKGRQTSLAELDSAYRQAIEHTARLK